MDSLLISDIDIDINNSTSAQLKGWLFEVYSRSGNIEAYNNINKRILAYRDKISKGISEEGYVLQDRVLQLEDEFRTRFELNNFQTRWKR